MTVQAQTRLNWLTTTIATPNRLSPADSFTVWINDASVIQTRVVEVGSLLNKTFFITVINNVAALPPNLVYWVVLSGNIPNADTYILGGGTGTTPAPDNPESVVPLAATNQNHYRSISWSIPSDNAQLFIAMPVGVPLGGVNYNWAVGVQFAGS